ncbi:hypothetical protein CEXT_455491 [Caerostris extrusa]|uniref:Uncharacterized protein n=1 Tax=Caerostris extrusa TaxID=172846 RepID=A0AAV4TSX7_CAEEX|nr:hypothetical protein CEXT_455491 [Caerostris extrusa]
MVQRESFLSKKIPFSNPKCYLQAPVRHKKHFNNFPCPLTTVLATHPKPSDEIVLAALEHRQNIGHQVGLSLQCHGIRSRINSLAHGQFKGVTLAKARVVTSSVQILICDVFCDMNLFFFFDLGAVRFYSKSSNIRRDKFGNILRSL